LENIGVLDIFINCKDPKNNMNLDPLVSVIVPNYNHANFLEERLNSIVNQTFKDYEIILMDDASTDQSVTILKKFSTYSKVSHLVINKKNSGSPFKQWKKGIELAKGKYIWIAESDDSCKPIFIQELLSKFTNNIVLVYCASRMIAEDGDFISLDPWSQGNLNKRWAADYVNNGKVEIKDHLRYNNTIPNASAVIFKKDALTGINIPVKMRFCGDWYLWMEILKKGDLAFIHLPLNNFRNHQKTTRTIGDYRTEEARMKEYIFNIKNNSSLPERIKSADKYSWLINEMLRNKRKFKNYSVNKLKLPVDLLFLFFKNYIKNQYLMLKAKIRNQLNYKKDKN